MAPAQEPHPPAGMPVAGQTPPEPVVSPPPGERQLSALPSVRARALAFAAILAAGACGGLIGWSFVTLQCQGDCTVPGGIGAVVGAVVAAGGVAVVSVLTLRAMGEWRRVKEAELFNEG